MKSFWLAGKKGLHRTAHACEDGPPRNVETCLDLLGCERIDHGYHVIKDDKITKRCVDDGIVFTVTPASTAWVYFNEDLENHPIRDMAMKGLKIMVSCDDPPMFKTNPTKEYILMAEHMEFKPVDFRKFIINGIDGTWLDNSIKRHLRTKWSEEIDNLIAEIR